MTQIMEIIMSDQRRQTKIRNNQSESLQLTQKMQNFFINNSIQWYRQNQEFIALLSSQFYLNKQNQQLEIIATLNIRLQHCNFLFELNLFDENGCAIRARSQHQKTGLVKYCNSLNSSSQNISFRCNPLTGQVKFSFNYFASEYQQIDKRLENILVMIKDSKNSIQKILQFLEYIPLISNKYLQNISRNMQKCRTMVLGQHKHYIHSDEQQLHVQIFSQPINQTPIVYSFYERVANQKYFEFLHSRLAAKLSPPQQNKAKNPRNKKDAKMKCNWTKIQISQQTNAKLRNLYKLGKHIQQDNHEIVYSMGSRNDLETASVKFESKSSTQIQKQIQVLERIHEKFKKDGTFYSFIREYYCINNSEDLNKYMIYKSQQFKSINLNELKTKNKMVLSFQSRLHLCFELVSVALIGMQKIRDFLPSYQTYDLKISQDYSVKLETIASYQKNTVTSVQVAQTCYQILYNIRCSSHCLKQVDSKTRIHKWFHNVKSIDDGQSKYHGVTILNYWLKKILLDLINNSEFPMSQINTYIKSVNIRKADSTQKSYENPQLEMIQLQLNESNRKLSEKQRQQIKKRIMIQKQLRHLKKLLFVVAVSYKYYAEIFNNKVQILNFFDLPL